MDANGAIRETENYARGDDHMRVVFKRMLVLVSLFLTVGAAAVWAQGPMSPPLGPKSWWSGDANKGSGHDC